MRVVEGVVGGRWRTPRPLVASMRVVTESPIPRSVEMPIMISSAPNFLKIANLTASLTKNIKTNVARRIHVAVIKAYDLFAAGTDAA